MRRFLVLAVMLIAGGILRIVIQESGLPGQILPAKPGGVVAATLHAEVNRPNLSSIDGRTVTRKETVPTGCPDSRTTTIASNAVDLLSSLRSTAESRGGLYKVAQIGWRPDWSPAGDRILFLSSQPSPGLFVFDLESRKSVLIIQASDIWSARFSPDGKKIAFSRRGQGIFIHDIDAGTKQVSPRAGAFLQWSPDGRYIISATKMLSPISEPLVLLDLTTRAERRVSFGMASPRGRLEGGQFAWASATSIVRQPPRGTWGGLNDLSDDALACFDVETGQLAGSIRVAGVFGRRRCYFPEISPDGASVACSAGEPLSFVSSTGAARMIGNTCEAIWSPDGAMLVGSTHGCSTKTNPNDDTSGVWVMLATNSYTMDSFFSAVRLSVLKR